MIIMKRQQMFKFVKDNQIVAKVNAKTVVFNLIILRQCHIFRWNKVTNYPCNTLLVSNNVFLSKVNE